MKLLLDFPTIGEPHYAQAIPASLIKDNQVRIYELADNRDPFGSKSERDAKVIRKGNRVDISMTAIRSHFAPDNIEGVQVGDTVYFHVTNLEQDWDVPHGFAVIGAHNSELLVMPGQTRTLVWVPERGRRLPVLLHRLLLGAAPGDAGIHPGVAEGVERAGHRLQRRRSDCRGNMRTTSRIGVAMAALALAILFVAPLWRVDLKAPQYPEGLGLRIWINQITGCHAERTSTASTGSITTSG